MTEYTPKRIFNKYFILIWLETFALQMGQNIYNSTISVYAVSAGYSNTFAGSLAIPYMILAIFGRLAGGYISDNKSRRLAMILGCGAFAAGSFIYNIPALAIPVILFTARGIHGFGYAAGSTSYSAAVVDVIPPKDLSSGLGINWTAQGVSQFLSGIVIAALVIGSDYIPLFTSATVFTALAVLFAFLCSYEKGSEKPSSKKSISLSDLFEKQALPYALVTIVYYFGISVGTFYTMTLAAERGINGSGLFFTLVAVGMVAANLSLSKIAGHIGLLRALVPVFVIGAACMVILANAFSFGALMIAGVCYGISIGAMPLIQGAAVQGLPANKRGAGTSTVFLAMDIAMGIGPVIWGAVIDTLGLYACFYGAALFIIAAVVIAFPVFRK